MFHLVFDNKRQPGGLFSVPTWWRVRTRFFLFLGVPSDCCRIFVFVCIGCRAVFTWQLLIGPASSKSLIRNVRWSPDPDRSPGNVPRNEAVSDNLYSRQCLPSKVFGLSSETICLRRAQAYQPEASCHLPGMSLWLSFGCAASKLASVTKITHERILVALHPIW